MPYCRPLHPEDTQPCPQPGDLIAYSGTSPIARAIQKTTRSPYSHLAIVLDWSQTSQHDSPLHSQDLLIAESAILTQLPNYQGYPCRSGLQIHRLSSWIAAYGHHGQTWWVPLKAPLSPTQRQAMQDWLWALHHQQIGFGYGKLLSLGLSHLLNKPISLRVPGVLCSELVTQALQRTDRVAPTICASLQTPADVIRFPCFCKPVPLNLASPASLALTPHEIYDSFRLDTPFYC
jgi:hypothetical protein